MPKYVAIHNRVPVRSYHEYVDDRPSPATITVIVDDDSPVETGLYDVSGTPLYRLSDRNPCGFTARYEHNL